MPYEITQCYLPPGIGDFPAFTSAEAGTRFSNPGGMQGWVDLYFSPDNGHPHDFFPGVGNEGVWRMEVPQQGSWGRAPMGA